MKKTQKQRRPLTAEEREMAALMKASIAAIPKLTEEIVGAQVGVSQGQVSHWTGARLPVPASRALKLAAVLQIDDPARISVAYRNLKLRVERGGGVQGDLRPDLALARVENDIHALRLVISAMVAVEAAHRPVEGAALATALRQSAPGSYANRGFVPELLQTLDKAEQAAQAAASRRPAKPQA